MRFRTAGVPFARLLLPLLALVLLTAVSADAKKARPRGKTLLVGALLSLTGEWQSLGVTSQAALEIGVSRINDELRAAGSRDRVKLLVEDTKLDSTLALKKLKRLAARGVRTVIGPQSSAELAALKPYAERRGILLLSQGSTAGSLAVAGDNVFRFCPSDGPEGEAIAALMRADGIRAAVPLWRADAGNQGLATSLRQHFTAAGGTVSAGLEYSTETSDFSQVVADARQQVLDAQATFGNDVAVFLASFDELVALFRAARLDPTLAGVKWYGTDGVARSAAILTDADAAAFAVAVGFSAPTMGLPEDARPIWEPLSTEIEARAGIAPDAFGLAASDALWVAFLADRTARSGKIAVRRKVLSDTASRFFGATGWTVLNEAGDRAIGNYDFWALQESGGGYEWVRSARYSGGTISR
ncbi:MAG: ABC transporter substrate-binding protein [Armatimonadota bacterium]